MHRSRPRPRVRDDTGETMRKEPNASAGQAVVALDVGFPLSRIWIDGDVVRLSPDASRIPYGRLPAWTLVEMGEEGKAIARQRDRRIGGAARRRSAVADDMMRVWGYAELLSNDSKAFVDEVCAIAADALERRWELVEALIRALRERLSLDADAIAAVANAHGVNVAASRAPHGAQPSGR